MLISLAVFYLPEQLKMVSLASDRILLIFFCIEMIYLFILSVIIALIIQKLSVKATYNKKMSAIFFLRVNFDNILIILNKICFLNTL